MSAEVAEQEVAQPVDRGLRIDLRYKGQTQFPIVHLNQPTHSFKDALSRVHIRYPRSTMGPRSLITEQSGARRRASPLNHTDTGLVMVRSLQATLATNGSRKMLCRGVVCVGARGHGSPRLTAHARTHNRPLRHQLWSRGQLKPRSSRRILG